MRVLVLGGTRFIGAAAVRALVERGHEVTCFHRGLHEVPLPGSVRHVHGERPELLAHRRELGAPEAILDQWAMEAADATRLLGAARTLGSRRVVVASSADVYRAFGLVLGKEQGPLEPVPLTEGSALRANRYPYRAEPPRAPGAPDAWQDRYDKLDVEELLLAASDLEPVVVRLPMVHGPGDPRRRVGEYLRRMRAGRRAIVMAESVAGWQACRGFVDDVGRGLALALEVRAAAGRVYHLAEPARTEREWAEAIARASGWEGTVKVVPDPALPAPLRPAGMNLAQRLALDTSRAQSELGWEPRVDPHEALLQAIAWERSEPAVMSEEERKAEAAEEEWLAAHP